MPCANALQTPSGAPDTKSLPAWPSLLTPPASTEERVSRNFQAPDMYRESPPVDALAHRPTVMRCGPQHVGPKGPWMKALCSQDLTHPKRLAPHPASGVRAVAFMDVNSPWVGRIWLSRTFGGTPTTDRSLENCLHDISIPCVDIALQSRARYRTGTRRSPA